MHNTVYEAVAKFVETLDSQKTLLIADIGAQSINGNLRSLFDKPQWTYHGIDRQKDDNIDIEVGSETDRWNIEDNTYDVIVSVSTLEHTEFPWLVVAQMARILKPGGVGCITAPYAWPQHGWPLDCWRIFPDGMKAVLRYNGLTSDKVYTEKYTEPGLTEHCGDTIAIFSKSHAN